MKAKADITMGFVRHGANNYIKRGPCLDVVGSPSMRSSWERNFFRVLQLLHPPKDGWLIEYERHRYAFGKPYRRALDYLPDFVCTMQDGGAPFIFEVKGFLDSRGRTRLQGFKKHYPDLVPRLSVVTDPANFPWFMKAMRGCTLISYPKLRQDFAGLVRWE